MNNKGCLPSKIDDRDYKYSNIIKKLDVVSATLPEQVDLRKNFPRIFWQGYLNSCVSQVTTAFWYFLCNKANKDNRSISRLYLYYFARKMDNTQKINTGTTYKNAFKILNTVGVSKETKWWHIPFAPFHLIEPFSEAKADSSNQVGIEYYNLNNLDEVKSCLAEGYPVAIGFNMPESFSKSKLDGTVDLPKQNEFPTGGHAILIVGYNDIKKQFICRNSWGILWGKAGYFYVDYDYYFGNYISKAFDVWTMRLKGA